MWPSRKLTADRLERALEHFSTDRIPLLGVVDLTARRTLALQMVASLRRLDYTHILLSRTFDSNGANPNSSMFDPERAAIIHARAGNLDEAIWVIFLATHFGKHARHGWRMLKDVYSGLSDTPWTWVRIQNDPELFRTWLRDHVGQIGGSFGNHRKYETLGADSVQGTANVFASYVGWINTFGSHAHLIRSLVTKGGNDPHNIFDVFYNEMNILRFGRLGKFDFLALIGRLKLAPITPGSPYLKGATGPLRGSRLLFAGDPEIALSPEKLEENLKYLDQDLNVGMQVLEDSLCNWQKSPEHFIHFRG